eukprot:TRINITY_DN5787_c0_g1_i1.p1 TRINITY_DN5787_c0_g1~~TRINITY_DN5787_c0_g1_i1.p1  ORF type:complete len:498 (-),score=100.77 TRINITY_DN5787_c0_g1_i1:13-1341(-)
MVEEEVCLTPLLAAVQAGSLDIVRLALAAGANVDQQSEVGNSPLFFAASLRHVGADIARELIRRGANPGRRNRNGDTPLLFAAASGAADTVRCLLECRGSVDAQNKAGLSALMCAAAHGHTDVIRLILASGCDVNLRDAHGNTALHHAVTGGHCECVEVLLASGADITIRNHKDKTCYHQSQEMASQRSASSVRCMEALKKKWDELTNKALELQHLLETEEDKKKKRKPTKKKEVEPERRVEPEQRVHPKRNSGKKNKKPSTKTVEFATDANTVAQTEEAGQSGPPCAPPEVKLAVEHQIVPLPECAPDHRMSPLPHEEHGETRTCEQLPPCDANTGCPSCVRFLHQLTAVFPLAADLQVGPSELRAALLSDAGELAKLSMSQLQLLEDVMQQSVRTLHAVKEDYMQQRKRSKLLQEAVVMAQVLELKRECVTFASEPSTPL